MRTRRPTVPVPLPCPGSENNAWRQAEQDLAERDIPHELTFREGQPVHCAYCTERAHRELAELPELIAAIWLEATHGTRPRLVGTIGRTSEEPPWPPAGC
jgi:hypothetical protein